jgi:hypothetical protein
MGFNEVLSYWAGYFRPKKKPQILQHCGAFFEFRIGFYLWDLSSALKVKTLRATAIPNETSSIANLDWVWPEGKIR